MLDKLFKGRKSIRKDDLRNIDVELVSLLFDDVKPANGKSAVVKSASGTAYEYLGSSKKYKSDKQGRLYVTVMEPGVVDSQGDKTTTEEIVKAMDHFAEKGMIGRNDVNHNMHPIDEFYVTENYILKAEDKEHFPDTKVGSWVQVIKCKNLNSELWKRVEKGQFNGVSIYGEADVYQQKADKSELLKELKELRTEIRKTGNKEAIDAITSRITDLEKAETTQEVTEIVKAMQDMTKILTKAINKSLPGEPGGDKVEEKEIIIKGEKVVVKDYHREIVEKFSQDGDPEKMNILVGNTSNQFIDETIETIEDETLKEITVAEMTKDNKVDAGLIEDLILKNELDGEPTAAEVTGSEIEVTPYILKSEVKVSRTTLEAYKDKYGEEAFLAYMLKKLGNKVLKALKKLLFKGDRDSETATLKGLNGVLALATDGDDVTTVDTSTYLTYATRIAYALKQFTEDMLEHMDKFVIYVSNKDLIDIRAEAELQKNSRGSRLTVDGRKCYFDGVEIKGRFMTDDYMIIGVPAFIIIGVRTDAEVARRFIPWYYHWYLRLRAGITYVTGFIKVFKLEASGS